MIRTIVTKLAKKTDHIKVPDDNHSCGKERKEKKELKNNRYRICGLQFEDKFGEKVWDVELFEGGKWNKTPIIEG